MRRLFTLRPLSSRAPCVSCAGTARWSPAQALRMSRGLGGPKPAEIRGGLGIDRNITTEVVPTASQAGAYSATDKQNTGYSGTPLWKLALERAKEQEAAGALGPSMKIPEGFKPVDKVTAVHLPVGKWYYSDKRSVFWNSVDGKMYVWDSSSGRHKELYDAASFEMKVLVGSCFHENAVQVRRVLVPDLAKAGQALRLSIEHLDRPCALYALYEGHRGSPASGTANACAEFCARHLHQKLLLKLAAFRGYWEDDRLEAAMRESFEELDEEYAAKHPSTVDGCCAAVALLTGSRLVLANLGDVAAVVCTQNGEAVEQIRPHAVRNPDEEDDDEDDEELVPAANAAQLGGSAASSNPPIRWTRAFGDLDFKSPSSSPRLSATPECAVLSLQHGQRGVALVCRALFNAIGKSVAVSTVFRRSRLRPRMASGSLVDAAVQWLGQVGDHGLGAVVVCFEQAELPTSAAPPTKKPKVETPSQVRLRHILLKHRDCKSVVDKVRNKQVKRTRGEAERLLRAVLEECEGDPKKRVFNQRCRELSECVTCLQGGDLAGDLGWVKPGKHGQAFDAAAFSLRVGDLSDLVDTEQGIHVIMRAA